ncbi:uncharacterized protein PV09_05849 [Verruconis gallopava]|uniref:DJ-1/PfpI domain-containing protein n=1 Tax=Verruconis gallopava TaxID=253628 RepID=A0A0D2A7P7_9PEZI|nr:uncharacterized protein PV09_05849 [Verruconis gallopava]KIW02788.1 hypothetical protein PV09_05849 [Verruconis gallopava]
MPLNLKNPDRPIHVGVILMGVTEVLDVAPIDLLHGLTNNFMEAWSLRDSYKAKGLDMEFHWVTQNGTPGQLTSGIKIEATDSFETCAKLDIVLIGAYAPGYSPTEAELAFIRQAYEHSSAFITICGGFVPAQLAGVLVGHTCTAPRSMIPKLQKEDPRTTWVEKRYVRDGKLWSSGTLLNGLDLMSNFCLEYWPELAETLIPLSGLPERSIDY